MGQGIAQLASQAGARVLLKDARPGAAEQARQQLLALWTQLNKKQKITSEQAAEYAARLFVVDDLAAFKDCDLVVEAIVERMDAKQQLLRELEDIVAPSAIIASNTSALSITTLATALRHPRRFAGFHFFNPAPLMKVVEIVQGLATDEATCDVLASFARRFGHTPVRAQDTPGFLVNHLGRGYVTEALRIAQEGIADFATVDRILRDQAGFRLGPFELMDLTGLDVTHAVMEYIYGQYYQEPRYRPSPIAAQRVAAGLLGRKTGQGFYRYAEGRAEQPAEPSAPQVRELPPVWVSPRAARRPEIYQLLKNLGARIETGQAPSEQALILVAPLGLDVTTVAAVERLDPTRTLGIDMLVDDASTRRRVLATNPATRSDMRDAAHALFASDGKAVSVIRDSGGFVTQRVVGSIVNIASDICQQGIGSPADLEKAVTLGLGYPMGPLAMGDRWGPTNVLEVLFNLQTVYGDPRYRPSPWLRRRGALGLSLTHEEQ
ncbi:Probable 3-hydroxybutyryl-CoA dehydrogenase [Delftia tsuruhatensis]|nr:Probable 3-hydroxybutyryl-CoA dehydrogenase [Delftia tsuruhatensis]CAC9686038.1 Probable 3-hydroxybutyryl-CoA dehydrogenase [Delftia tsuruhatensis]